MKIEVVLNTVTAFSPCGTILRREFCDIETEEYVCLEAHETDVPGVFNCAEWVPEGNNGGPHGASYETAIKWLADCEPSELIEQPIPEELWC